MSTVAYNQTPLWIEKLNKLINLTLSYDEETVYRLNKLKGNVISLEFVGAQLAIFIFFEKKGIKINDHFNGKPDVLLKGTPNDFIKMIVSSKQDGNHILPSGMRLLGDVNLAQRFQTIMQDIDIDLEELLSKYIGDTLAYKLLKFVKTSGRFVLNTSKIMAMDLSEYLRFEIEILPDDILIGEFCQDINILRSDVDRLTQQLSKLEARINDTC